MQSIHIFIQTYVLVAGEGEGEIGTFLIFKGTLKLLVRYFRDWRYNYSYFTTIYFILNILVV